MDRRSKRIILLCTTILQAKLEEERVPVIPVIKIDEPSSNTFVIYPVRATGCPFASTNPQERLRETNETAISGGAQKETETNKRDSRGNCY